MRAQARCHQTPTISGYGWRFHPPPGLQGGGGAGVVAGKPLLDWRKKLRLFGDGQAGIEDGAQFRDWVWQPPLPLDADQPTVTSAHRDFVRRRRPMVERSAVDAHCVRPRGPGPAKVLAGRGLREPSGPAAVFGAVQADGVECDAARPHRR